MKHPSTQGAASQRRPQLFTVERISDVFGHPFYQLIHAFAICAVPNAHPLPLADRPVRSDHTDRFECIQVTAQADPLATDSFYDRAHERGRMRRQPRHDDDPVGRVHQHVRLIHGWRERGEGMEDVRHRAIFHYVVAACAPSHGSGVSVKFSLTDTRREEVLLTHRCWESEGA